MSSKNPISLTSPFGRLKLITPDPIYDEEMAKLRSHPETLRYLPILPAHVTTDEARLRREERAAQDSILDLHVLLDNGDGSFKFVGMAGLYNIDRTSDSCYIGILIHPDYFRSGFATQVLYTIMKYAFEDPAYLMHRVVYDTAADNVQMRGWLERVAGVHVEFTLREAWKVRKGKYIDVMGFSILENEWSDSVKGKLEARLYK